MGELRQHDIAGYASRYGLKHFVETGTWKAHGLWFAAQLPWETMTSIDVNPAYLIDAEIRMSSRPHPETAVRLIHGDSAAVFPSVISSLPSGTALFWLDAHLPRHYSHGHDGTVFPLIAELAAVVNHDRSHAGDVFIMDDLRVYKRGPFAAGDYVGDILDGELDRIHSLLSPTHALSEDFRMEGYLLAVPR